MEFVAIDFETANRNSDSACSIGLVTFKDGKIVDEYYKLIRPKNLYFHPDNIKVHGLTEEMVADEPTLLEIWEEILPRLQGKQVVAHFAKFDMGVLKGSLASWKLPLPEFDFICSWMLSKKALPHLESFGLKSVAESVGFKFQHHHALEDARACATAVAQIMKQCGAQDFEQLAGHYNLELGRMWRGGVRQCSEKPEGEPVMESLF